MNQIDNHKKKIGALFKNKTPAGIKWKIFFSFIIFSFVLISLLWIYQTVLLGEFYRSVKISELKRHTSVIKEYLLDEYNETEPLSYKKFKFENFLSQLASRYEVGIMVTDYDFNHIYMAGNSLHSIIPHLRVSEFFLIYEKALEDGGSVFQSYNIKTHALGKEAINFERGTPSLQDKRKGAAQDLLYASLIDFPDGRQFIIMVDTVVTPLFSTVRTLSNQLMQISIIMVIIALILAFIVSKVISKPIIQVNEAAKSLAYGKFEPPKNRFIYREIEQLINTLQKTSTELSKNEALRRELIANVSHDLRTPLTMIVGYGEILRDIPSENNSENIQVIIEEAKRLTLLVNSLLELSKFQAGISELNLEKCSVYQLLFDITSTYKKLTEKDEYNIIFESDNKDIYIMCDKTKIIQAIYNLLNNALQHTGEDKKVTLRQKTIEDIVRIEIADSGEGIAIEDLPYIWDRYYTTNRTEGKKQYDTGLGLSIVKSVFEMHNIKYGVISKAFQGSVFWFEIPSV